MSSTQSVHSACRCRRNRKFRPPPSANFLAPHNCLSSPTHPEVNSYPRQAESTHHFHYLGQSRRRTVSIPSLSFGTACLQSHIRSDITCVLPYSLLCAPSTRLELRVRSRPFHRAIYSTAPRAFKYSAVSSSPAASANANGVPCSLRLFMSPPFFNSSCSIAVMPASFHIFRHTKRRNKESTPSCAARWTGVTPSSVKAFGFAPFSSSNSASSSCRWLIAKCSAE